MISKIHLLFLAFALFACGTSERSTKIAYANKPANEIAKNLEEEKEISRLKMEADQRAKEEERAKMEAELRFRAEEEKKQMVRNNIFNYVKTTLDYVSLTFGGFEDVIVGINNTSDYLINEVGVTVYYINVVGVLYKREYVTLYNIKDNYIKRVYAPNSSRGTQIRLKINYIHSDALNLRQRYE